MARPTKRTPDAQAKIFTALKEGNTRKTAVACAGINYDTFCEWLKIPEFSDQVTRAEEFAVEIAVKSIRKAAIGTIAIRKVKKTYKQNGVEVVEETVTTSREFDWRAAAWFLERKRPEDWKERKELDLSKLSNEQLLALLESEGESPGGGSSPRVDS